MESQPLSVDIALTWVSDLPFWSSPPGWPRVVRRVLRCARHTMYHRSPIVNLPFWCAEAVGCAPEQVLPVAAAWLLLYIAAGLLDAVEDDHYEPHDWDNLHQGEAINVASAFLAAIPLILAESEHVYVTDLMADFQRAALDMAAGQHADLSGWVGDGGKAEERYWQVVRAKSGTLFALACRAIARLGAKSSAVLSAYTDFGHAIGQLIQACDDYEDFYESDNLADFRVGQASLPIVYGRTVANSEERGYIETLFRQATTAEYAVSQLRQLLDDLGARHYLLLKIEQLGQQAQEALQRTLAVSPDSDRLLELISYLTGHSSRTRHSFTPQAATNQNGVSP